MSRKTRREWCDEHGEAFPMEEEDECEQRHFECPECARWFDWDRRIYIRKADNYYCPECAELIGEL